MKNATIHAEAVQIQWIHAEEGADQNTPKKFSMVAYTGGAMQVSAYGPPVVIDLEGVTAKAPIPILLNHDAAHIVGHADTVEVAGRQLKLSGVISGTGPAAVEVVGNAHNGFPWKASVGARPDKLEFVGEDVTTKVNGQTFKGPLYVARKSTLGEVSFVAMAADGRTSAKVAASAAKQERNETMDFEAWVQALGLDLAELRDDQRAKLQAKYDSEAKAAQKAGEPIDAAAKKTTAFDLSGIVLAYEKHVASVQAKAAGYHGKIDAEVLAEIQANVGTKAAELKAQALNEEWATPRFEVALVKAAADAEVALIRAERPKAPAIHASSRDGNPQAIEAAFAMSCGLQAPDKVFKPEVIDAAQRDFRNLGLQELLLIHARANGYTGRPVVHGGNVREVLASAFSTHSLTTLLTSTGNKLLWEGFSSIPQRWSAVAQTRNVSDFKTVTAYRMTSSLEYEELPASGEIKHGTVGQETYTMSAKTYAKMAALTRNDIINDDLGALNDIRNRLGIGAVSKMEKVFWLAWLAASSGGAFWTTARGNLVAGSALAEAGLNTAVKAFREMKGPDNVRLGLSPRYVLVPTALEATAKKIYASTEIRDTTATTKYPTANIYAGMFEPIPVPELGDSDYSGYSATTWWLLADPRVMASAVMCFLNNQQSPTIESADADFNVLGIQFRGYHDFGVAMSEYLASVKATA